MNMLQNWKDKLAYIGFGTLFGCLCTIIGMLASPVTAQRDKFGEIECTGLNVIGKDGQLVSLSTDEQGGAVTVYAKDGKSGVSLHVRENGGALIMVYNEDTDASVFIYSSDDSGKMEVHGKGGIAVIGGTEHGGYVKIEGKNKESTAILTGGGHGGLLSLEGKGEGKVVIGFDDYGNGGISTWDKNGNRQ